MPCLVCQHKIVELFGPGHFVGLGPPLRQSTANKYLAVFLKSDAAGNKQTKSEIFGFGLQRRPRTQTRTRMSEKLCKIVLTLPKTLTLPRRWRYPRC
jgi:hypothetical protein